MSCIMKRYDYVPTLYNIIGTYQTFPLNYSFLYIAHISSASCFIILSVSLENNKNFAN